VYAPLPQNAMQISLKKSGNPMCKEKLNNIDQVQKEIQRLTRPKNVPSSSFLAG